MQLEERVLPALDERVYEARVEPGAEVVVIRKPGFGKKYATYATRYGSIDRVLQDPETGRRMEIPPGAAHFLEHKMFDKPEGSILERFARLGASMNAYTGHFYTVYLFSVVEAFEPCFELLLDYVQDPRFTPESVAKEQGIIGQEIATAYDHPVHRLYYDFLEAMYREHPVRDWILGSPESIATLTPELLEAIHRTYYHPANMTVCVVGDVDPRRVVDMVAADLARRRFPARPRPRREVPEEGPDLARPAVERQMAVSRPYVQWGIKVGPFPAAEEGLRDAVLGDLVAEALFGRLSPWYEQQYRRHVITDRYWFGLSVVPGAAHWEVGGETGDPDAFAAACSQRLGEALSGGLDPGLFEAVRRKALGEFLSVLDSPEDLAHAFLTDRFLGWDFYRRLEILERVDVEAADRWLREHADPRRTVRAAVLPGKEAAS
ncbi:EF-P 5-aminopentanol modification-associated protein YfmH [Thermaerobacter subterraneus]|uniref:Zn-dependent peptidase n=1 Tax=Thermaerobacter subterraneus DSM 13965 TaxID=867903 RepID=K6QFE9_9FIRM|nr:pitrilysin family protein [Thermaerobacter subterraneus]EKP95731.1 putative Zn-dependent peptidase [Thermaerobacter subterraneus DSM 13965]